MSKLLLLEAVSIVIALFLIAPSLAADNYAKGSIIDLNNLCRNDGALCASGLCNKTVIYPNGSIMVDNQNMTRTGARFNYTIPDSDILGEYTDITVCCDGTNCETVEDNFIITYAGYDEINPLNIIIAGGIMAGLLILLALFTKERELFMFKISFTLFALLIILIIIPSALLSERVAYTLFKWGAIISYLFGVLVLIYISYLIYNHAVGLFFNMKK